jgi:hypothetical protein
MGHYVFMCSTHVESKTRLSRRKRRHLRAITCFGCKDEDELQGAYYIKDKTRSSGSKSEE